MICRFTLGYESLRKKVETGSALDGLVEYEPAITRSQFLELQTFLNDDDFRKLRYEDLATFSDHWKTYTADINQVLPIVGSMEIKSFIRISLETAAAVLARYNSNS